MKKTIIKKILLICFIILLLNVIFINISNADEAKHWAITTADALIDVILSDVGIRVAILTIPLRLVAILAGNAINTLTANIAYVDGATDGNFVQTFITPFDIFFNKIKLFDINFFDLLEDGSIAAQIRTSVAGWYYVMRTFSAAILLVILIYVGIRMAISTIASDRAMYKKMLVDWVASLALIFVLQYIMLFVINVNNAIVDSISSIVITEGLENAYDEIKSMAIPTDLSLKSIKAIFTLDSLAAAALFVILVWQTFGLVLSYFNRMLKIAFLIIISPLISLTYSIDKMGDGKAQALGTWFKEFIFTILIQPFHCVIYMCFIDAAMTILIDNAGLGTGALAASIMAILCVRFTKDAEKIVRKIFGFKDDSSATSLAAGLMGASMVLNKSKDFGKAAKNTVTGAKKFIKSVNPVLKSGLAKGIAVAALLKDKKDGNESNATFKERTEEAENKIDNASAEFREKINDKLDTKIRENKVLGKFYRKTCTPKSKFKGKSKPTSK